MHILHSFLWKRFFLLSLGWKKAKENRTKKGHDWTLMMLGHYTHIVMMSQLY